jgi:hypothetical protein
VNGPFRWPTDTIGWYVRMAPAVHVMYHGSTVRVFVKEPG